MEEPEAASQSVVLSTSSVVNPVALEKELSLFTAVVGELIAVTFVEVPHTVSLKGL